MIAVPLLVLAVTGAIQTIFPPKFPPIPPSPFAPPGQGNPYAPPTSRGYGQEDDTDDNDDNDDNDSDTEDSDDSDDGTDNTDDQGGVSE